MEELFGRRPPVITAVLARVTYELMIEQQRQEEMADLRARKVNFDVPPSDVVLKMNSPEIWKWMRKIQIKI